MKLFGGLKLAAELENCISSTSALFMFIFLEVHIILYTLSKDFASVHCLLVIRSQLF